MTAVNNTVTNVYLQKISRGNYLALVSSIFLVILGFVWMFFHFGGEHTTTIFSDLLYVVCAWFGTCCCWITAYRLRWGPLRGRSGYQMAWFFVGLGQLMDGSGGAYAAYLDLTGQPTPIPSYADIGYTLYYPLIFVGLLFLLTRSKPLRFRIRSILETFITTLCLLGLSWYFFLGPTVLTRQGSPLSMFALIVSFSYPFWDMLLIFVIIFFIWQRTEPLLTPSLFLCCTGLLATIWGDTGYAYFTSLGIYTPGTVSIDPFWPISSLLIGLSALLQYTSLLYKNDSEPRAQEAQKMTNRPYAVSEYFHHYCIIPILNIQHRILPHTESVLLGLFFYLPLTVLLTLTLFAEVTQRHVVSSFLVMLTVAIVVLIAIRFLLIFQEKEILLHEQERRRKNVEHLQILSVQLNEALDLDSVCERVVTLMISELGFDGALYLFFNEGEHALPSLPRLLARAIISPSQEISTWSIEENYVSSDDPMWETEREMIWAEQTLPLPPEVLAWHEKYHIYKTLFTPLVHQGRIVGSLGFCSRTAQRTNTTDNWLIKAYAARATTALEHARLYRHLQKAHQRLQELDQLKDQFMVTASHELRTPLTAVQGYLELLVQFRDSLTPDRYLEFLQHAQRGCEELMLLLNNVMDASRLEIDAGIQPAHLEPVAVQESLESVISLLEPQLAQQQHTIHLHLPQGLMVQADPVRLRQVLLNLSVNAMKYSPTGTPITFSANCTVDEIPDVVISVIDKGQGIAPDEQKSLFQRFVRLERDLNSSVRGSGLGLYISRRLVEAMGGNIWVESSGIPGEGSAFHFRLSPAQSRSLLPT